MLLLQLLRLPTIRLRLPTIPLHLRAMRHHLRSLLSLPLRHSSSNPQDRGTFDHWSCPTFFFYRDIMVATYLFAQETIPLETA